MVKKDLGLILAIVFASSVISGSLVFLGMQLKGNSSSAQATVENIELAFDNYVKKQEQKQAELQRQANAEEDKKNTENAKNLKPVSKSEHIRGSVNAPISVVTYSDFECPYCKLFHPTTEELVTAYPEKVNVVYRHWPLDFHDPLATHEAVASECVAELGGNDAFWQFADGLYATTTSNGDGINDEQMLALATAVGVDKTAFSTCLKSGKYDQKIQQDIAEGAKAGVTGTPGNFVMNNKTGEVVFVKGAQDLRYFQTVIDPMLK